MGHIKKRKYVGTNDVVADVVKAIEKDGRWDSVGAAKRLGAKNAAVEAAVDAFHAWIDSVEATAVSAVEEQVELRNAHTVQLPLDGMPEALRAVTVVHPDGTKEILSLAQASPNQHKTMTSFRAEVKKEAYERALARDRDSDRILAQVGAENADKPFGEIFPADVFPQVNTAAPLKEIGDGE